MENHIGSTFQRLNRALDQLLSRLTEDLNVHIGRNTVFVNNATDKVEVRLRGCREADFNFRKTNFQQQIPETHFFVHAHGVDEGLITITQIHTAPARCLGQYFPRPLAIWQINSLKRLVFVKRHRRLGAPTGWLTTHSDHSFCLSDPALPNVGARSVYINEHQRICRTSPATKHGDLRLIAEPVLAVKRVLGGQQPWGISVLAGCPAGGLVTGLEIAHRKTPRRSLQSKSG